MGVMSEYQLIRPEIIIKRAELDASPGTHKIEIYNHYEYFTQNWG